MAADLDQLLIHGRLAGALAVAAGCAVILPLRIRQAARSRQPTLWTLSLAVAAVALSMALQLAAAGLDAATGVPNTGRFLSNCAAMAAACALRVVVLHVAYGPTAVRQRARRHYTVLGVVLCGAAALFLATPPDPASAIGHPRHEALVYSSPYVYLYLAYLAVVLCLAAGTGYRHFGRATGLVRVSLALARGSCGLALVYCVGKAAYLLGHDLRVAVPGSEALVTRPLYMLAAGTGLAAVVVPTLGRPGTAVRDWYGRYRTYQRLFPLWRALTATTAANVLVTRRSRLASLLTVRDLPFQLYRRIIEIRDGQLALRPYRPATGPPEDAHRYAPTQEALGIRAALAALASGQPPRPVADEQPAPHPVNLAEEVAWLDRVARAYRAIGRVAPAPGLVRRPSADPDPTNGGPD